MSTCARCDVAHGDRLGERGAQRAQLIGHRRFAVGQLGPHGLDVLVAGLHLRGRRGRRLADLLELGFAIGDRLALVLDLAGRGAELLAVLRRLQLALRGLERVALAVDQLLLRLAPGIGLGKLRALAIEHALQLREIAAQGIELGGELVRRGLELANFDV